MSEPLYERCGICKGTLRVPDDEVVDWPRTCVCARSNTPGWWPVGLTVGQVDKLREERDRLAAALRPFAAALADLDEPGYADELPVEDAIEGAIACDLTVGDLRRAAAALTGPPAAETPPAGR